MYRIIIFGFVLLLSQVLMAQKVETNYLFTESSSFSEQDTLNGDLFFFGRFLNMKGEAQSDIYAGGQKININGDVRDDIFASGETVEITGSVGDGVIVWAKDVIISGRIYGDLRAWGGSIYIQDGAEIFGDVYAGCGYLKIGKAILHGNLDGGAMSMNIDGDIGGDIEYFVQDKPYFGPEFNSAGKVKLILTHQPEDMGNAPANIKTIITSPERFYSKATFYWLLMSAWVIGAILLGVFKGFHTDLVQTGLNKSLSSLGTGSVFVIVTPFVVIFSLLFLPMAFILLALYLIILYMAKIFTAYVGGTYLSQLLGKQDINPYVSFAIGLIILTLLTQIPFLGFLIVLLSLFFGSGVFLKYLWQLKKA